MARNRLCFYGVICTLVSVVKLEPVVRIFGYVAMVRGFGLFPNFSSIIKRKRCVYIFKRTADIFKMFVSGMEMITLARKGFEYLTGIRTLFNYFNEVFYNIFIIHYATDTFTLTQPKLLNCPE